MTERATERDESCPHRTRIVQGKAVYCADCETQVGVIAKVHREAAHRLRSPGDRGGDVESREDAERIRDLLVYCDECLAFRDPEETRKDLLIRVGKRVRHYRDEYGGTEMESGGWATRYQQDVCGLLGALLRRLRAATPDAPSEEPPTCPECGKPMERERGDGYEVWRCDRSHPAVWRRYTGHEDRAPTDEAPKRTVWWCRDCGWTGDCVDLDRSPGGLSPICPECSSENLAPPEDWSEQVRQMFPDEAPERERLTDEELARMDKSLPDLLDDLAEHLEGRRDGKWDAKLVRIAADRLRQPELAREGEGEPDHERQILLFFLEAREHFQDIYDWDDERAAEGFVGWVRETVQGFLDGKYDGGPHDPRRSDATAHHEGGSDE